MKKILLLLSVLLCSTSYSQQQGQGTSNPAGLPPPPPPFVPSVQLDIATSSGFTKLLTLGFLPSGADFGQWGTDVKDTESLSTDAFMLFSAEQYTSKGLTYNGSEDIPLSVKSASASLFTFSLHEMPDYNEIADVYLYDSRDRSYHDLKKGNYEAMVLPGTYPDRFKIRFTKSEMGNNDTTAVLIYQDNMTHAVKIRNPNNEPLRSLVLYDIYGRTVYKESNVVPGQDVTFPISGVDPGIYIAVLLKADNTPVIHKLLLSGLSM
jgi:hypothetical protein